MTEITSEQFEKYIGRINDTMGALEKLVRKLDTSRRAEKPAATKPAPQRPETFLGKMASRGTLENDLRRKSTEENGRVRRWDAMLGAKTVSLTNSLSLLDGHSRNLSSSFASLTKSFIGGAVIGTVIESIINLGTHWVEHYRELADVGQTFNSSMIDMARTAGQAGLPLNDFANYVKRNSLLMAQLGARDVTSFTKQVRVMSRQAGMYGYSVEQMNQLSADWLDMQRLQGNRNAIAQTGSVSAVNEMAKNISGLAGAFGTSREAIMEETKKLSNSGSIIAARILDPTLKGNKALEGSMQTLAAMTGNGGEMMRSFFQDIMSRGTVAFNGNFKMMQAAGIDMDGIMRRYKATIEANGNSSEAGVQASRRVMEEYADQILNNTAQIRNMGIAMPELLSLLEDAENIKGINWSEWEKTQANMAKMDRLTKGFLTIGERINDFKGKILESLLAGLGTFVDSFEKANSDFDWEDLTKMLKEFGSLMGVIVADIFKVFGKMDANTLANNIKTLLWAIKGVAQFGTQLLITGAKTIQFFQTLGKFIGGEEKGGLIGAIMAFTAFLGTKRFLSNLIGSSVGSMRVNAANVVINGRSLGGGGDLGVGGTAGKGSKLKSVASVIGRRALPIAAALGTMYGLSQLMSAMGDDGDDAAPVAAQPNTSSGGSNLGIPLAMLGGGAVLGSLRGIKNTVSNVPIAKMGAKLGGPLAGIGLEGLDYATGDKDITWRNMAKSGIALAGGGLGALAGGGIGSLALGTLGYGAGSWLGNTLLGPDDIKAPSTVSDTTNRAVMSDARRTADVLEQRLTPPEVTQIDMATNAAMLREMTAMRNVTEGMVMKMSENNKQNVQIGQMMREIRDNTKKS